MPGRDACQCDADFDVRDFGCRLLFPTTFDLACVWARIHALRYALALDGAQSCCKDVGEAGPSLKRQRMKKLRELMHAPIDQVGDQASIHGRFHHHAHWNDQRISQAVNQLINQLINELLMHPRTW